MGRLCYPTQHPGRVLVPRVLGAEKLSRCKEGMAHFLPSGTIFMSYTSVAVQVWSESRIYPRLQSWRRALAQCRDTMLNGASKLSRYTKHYCVQMRVSGCNNHYKFVLGAGVKAKSVTNNLPILSVLQVVVVQNLSCYKGDLVIIFKWIKTITLWISPCLMSWPRSIILKRRIIEQRKVFNNCWYSH